MKYLSLVVIFIFSIISQSCAQKSTQKTDQYWKEKLSKEVYHILRDKGTEAPFSGKYVNNKKTGVYSCAACKNKLFHSSTKFKSGTGWPSYYAPINKEALLNESDLSHGMIRNEVICSNCNGHLGHVFEDGPEPTGLRYCINSLALDFEETKKEKK